MAYPNNIDYFTTRIDKNASGWYIGNEYFNVPSSAPYMLYLDHVPKDSSTTIVAPSGGGTSWTEDLTGSPDAGEYYVDYSLGSILFNSTNAGQALGASYQTLGDDIMSEHINSIQSSISTIQEELGIEVKDGYSDLDERLNVGIYIPKASGIKDLGTVSLAFKDAYIDRVHLKANPTSSFEAATKQYVDDNTSELTIDHSLLNNLGWSSAGHTIDSNIVPTSSGTLSVGTNNLAFGAGHFDNLYCEFIRGDGSFLSGVSSGGGYVHYQTTPSSTWVVDHNLGTDEVIVQVADSSTPPVMVVPSGVEYTNDNRLTITLSSSIEGEARVVSASGSPSGGGGGGSSSFVGLSDTPSSYTGMSASGVRVNSSEDAIEFYGISNEAYETTATGIFYWGDPDTDSTWRLTREGDNLVAQRRESGSWVTKSTFTA